MLQTDLHRIADPLSRLKAGTDDLHHMLDRQSCMSRLLAHDLGVVEYADILQRLLACHLEFELVLQAFWHRSAAPPEWFVPSIFHRSSDLQADLQALGRSVSIPVDGSHAVQSSAKLEVSSTAAAVGCMYVLAGSSLGARVIQRRLREHMGPVVDGALRYFSPPASVTQWSWPAYRHALNEAIVQPDDEAAALSGARTMFSCFLRHLALNEEPQCAQLI